MPAAATLLPYRLLSVDIARPHQTVSDFLAAPENFPAWASGLGSLTRENDGSWVADTAEGRMRVRFTPRNEYGVADHVVTPPGDAPDIHIPMRVIRNGDGATVIFTLFRQPGMTDEVYARDAEWVMRDLEKLKAVLEGPA